MVVESSRNLTFRRSHIRYLLFKVINENNKSIYILYYIGVDFILSQMNLYFIKIPISRRVRPLLDISDLALDILCRLPALGWYLSSSGGGDGDLIWHKLRLKAKSIESFPVIIIFSTEWFEIYCQLLPWISLSTTTPWWWSSTKRWWPSHYLSRKIWHWLLVRLKLLRNNPYSNWWYYVWINCVWHTAMKKKFYLALRKPIITWSYGFVELKRTFIGPWHWQWRKIWRRNIQIVRYISRKWSSIRTTYTTRTGSTYGRYTFYQAWSVCKTFKDNYSLQYKTIGAIISENFR